MNYYPPSSCKVCGGPIMVQLASISDGEVTSWRTGVQIYPNYTDDNNKEVYDKAWCDDCQVVYHVEGR